jgi:hypothetical protein
VCCLVSCDSLVDQFFISQDQAEYSRSPPHVWCLELARSGRGKRFMLVLDHPRDGLQTGNLREQIIGHVGMCVVLCLLGR